MSGRAVAGEGADANKDTALLPPPPLPPPQPGSWAPKTHLKPQDAAMPYNIHPPIQETNPTAGALPDAQGEEAPPIFQEQDGQEDNHSDSEEICPPVQETDPAPQACHDPQVTEQQDEQSTHMDLAGEGRLA
ncbi:velvet complex subunit 2 isoform X1 [Scophthalmus maximus]|uniref:velvet complex subunit 2 isoform X1 n=1 Tax=Scophthalmus maximus TaxID=52904 RepID=UPI0015E07E17|nr:velvet complex subunit 2 isoform X1 [Scophthalmus maximus]